MTEKNPTTAIRVKIENANAILNYLHRQPFIEVVDLIDSIHKSEPLSDEIEDNPTNYTEVEYATKSGQRCQH